MECTLSMEALSAVVTRVGTSYEQACNVEEAHRSGYVAAKSGCTPIGRPSCYAGMVAVPDDMPEVVVKVCSNKEDGYILFALLCLQGLFPEKHWPRVYSGTKVGESWIFIIERLEEQDCRIDTGLRDLLYEQLQERMQEYTPRVATDLHEGNFMQRADGTVVCIDPVAGMDFTIGEDGQPLTLKEAYARDTRLEALWEPAQSPSDAKRRLLGHIQQAVVGYHVRRPKVNHMTRLRLRLSRLDFAEVDNRMLRMRNQYTGKAADLVMIDTVDVTRLRQDKQLEMPVIAARPHLQNPQFVKGVNHGNRVVC